MPSEKPDIQAIFNQAIALDSDEQRDRYLAQACGDDLQVRARVEALLRAHSEAGGFLGGKSSATIATEIHSVTEEPDTQIGPYKLLQQIGEGGMGVVFMAEQSEPVRRTVALKIIKLGMDTRQVIARFEAERQALALMDHPNIAKVLDAGTMDSGRPYFVMELVKGQPITRYCDEQHLTPRQRLELLLPVCQAIQHALQKGIIHRDIKPTNILVAEYDERPVPKVIDFGVAKAISQPLTERTMCTGFGQIIGTLEYMSPEQAKVNQLDIDTRSDIYSLGVLMYELLTGSTPFDAKRLRSAAFDEMLRIIREEEPPKPSTKLSESKDSLPSISARRQTEPAKLTRLVRGELDWIVMKALEKDRSRRYETASAMATDLQRFLHDEPVQACLPSVGYILRKFARRNKGMLAIAGAAVLGVLLALVGLIVSNVLITHERNLKAAALETARDNERAAKNQKEIAERNAIKAHEQEQIAAANEKKAKASEQLANRRYYAAQMNLAMQAWRAGEVSRVLELLEGLRPKSGPEDLRGFEWFYLWRLVNSGRGAPIAGHTNATMSVVFSLDGAQLASASWDGTVRLWDAQTGQELKVFRARGHVPWEVAISPDGKMLASSGKETSQLILWSVETGEPIHTLAGSIMGIAFSPEGDYVTGAEVNGANTDLQSWDVSTGEKRTLLAEAGIPVGMSEDRKTLATLVSMPDKKAAI